MYTQQNLSVYQNMRFVFIYFSAHVPFPINNLCLFLVAADALVRQWL